MKLMRIYSTLVLIAFSATKILASEVENQHIVLGTWQVSSTNYCPHICALDDEQTSSYANTIIELSKLSAKIGNKTCLNPSYVYRHLTSHEFYQSNYFPASDIGLLGETVTEVTLFCGEQQGNYKSGMRYHFYIKSQDEILLGVDGVEFLTKRVK